VRHANLPSDNAAAIGGSSRTTRDDDIGWRYTVRHDVDISERNPVLKSANRLQNSFLYGEARGET
jgi:hypothetical protein